MASAVRNTAIKRIQGDVREMMKDPSDQYYAAPLEDNMFDWHFTLRGPRDTEFEGGIYHGRILLPSDYPFKPPNIMLLTPNGRFEVRKKICLSISAYHPEEWQPAWGIRLILEALISFMPTKGEGAIGALDYPPQERRRLAKLSCDYKCDICGKVTDLLPEVKDDAGEKKPSKYADQIAQLHIHSLETPASNGASSSDAKPDNAEDTSALDQDASLEEKKPAPLVSPPSIIGEAIAVTREEEADPAIVAEHTPLPQPVEAPAAPPLPPRVVPVAQPAPAPQPVVTRAPDHVDTLLHYATVALTVALFALVYKKLLQMQGVLQA